MSTRPRVTRTLRQFTDLDADRDLTFRQEEKRRAQIARAREGQKGVSWKQLKTVIKNEAHKENWQKVEAQLVQLWKSAKELFGTEEPVEVVDDSCIFLIRLFLDQKIAMLKHTSEMRKVFGNFSNQQVNKICGVSKFL